jgi:hypothetical protein
LELLILKFLLFGRFFGHFDLAGLNQLQLAEVTFLNRNTLCFALHTLPLQLADEKSAIDKKKL